LRRIKLRLELKWFQCFHTKVAEILCIPRHDGKSMHVGGCGDHSVKKVIAFTVLQSGVFTKTIDIHRNSLNRAFASCTYNKMWYPRLRTFQIQLEA